MSKRSNWCLIGIPDDQGVMNVGGRVGAAGGPSAFRRQLARLKGRDGVHAACLDRGDLSPPVFPIEKSHEAAAELIRAAQGDSLVSVVVGGGHDHGYSHLLGLSRAFAGKKLGCINLDAHLDVRKPAPLIGSGSPFFLALESGVLHPSRFIEFGIQRHCNAPDLWDYVESKKVEIVPFEELRHGRAPERFAKALAKLAASCDVVAVSLDLDSAAAAVAPGVSAPQAEGFSGSEIVEMMELAGREKKVASLGIFELNPQHDLDDATARLAATAAYHFVALSLHR